VFLSARLSRWTKPATWALTIVILAFAAYLRFASLATCLPHRTSRPDEYPVLAATADIRQDFRLHYWIYPGLFVYTMWAWCYAAHLLVPSSTGGLTYAEAVRQAPANLILAGRTLSATAAVATVALTMLIGRRLGGRPTALLAGLLVAVNGVLVRDAHSMKADTLLSLAFLATIAVMMRQRTPGRARDGICLGAAVGAACGIKYSAITGVLAYAGEVVEGSGWRRFVPSGRLWVAGLTATVVFLVSSISIFFDWQGFRNVTAWNALGVFNTGPPLTPELSDVARYLPWSISGQSFDYHLTRSLRLGSGYLTAIVLLPALVWALAFAGKKFRVIAVCFLIYLVLIGTSAVRLVRYFSPIVPLVSLMVAGAIARGSKRVSSGSARAVLLVAVGLVLAAEPARRSLGFVRVAGEKDTRVLASEFLAAKLAPGTRVAILGTHIWPYGAPDVPPKLERLADAANVRPGDVVVTHDHHSIGFSRIAPGDLERAAPCRTELARFSPYDEKWRGSLYEPADAYYVPLDGFHGVVRPGPIVTIWRAEACAQPPPSTSAP